MLDKKSVIIGLSLLEFLFCISIIFYAFSINRKYESLNERFKWYVGYNDTNINGLIDIDKNLCDRMDSLNKYKVGRSELLKGIK